MEEYNSGYSETATPDAVITYTYGNANWPDQLTSYNGESIVYDAIGNANTYRGATLTRNGRRLTSYNGASYWYVTNIQGDVMYVADFTLNLSIGFESIGMFGSISVKYP